MKMNPNKQLMRSLLVLSMTVALAATAHAQGGYDQGRYDRRGNTSNVGGSIQITFGSQPRWVSVPGTRVRQVRLAQAPDYDMFRYGGVYYVYSNDQWYMSRRPQGRFFLIDDSRVPRELYVIPRDQWRHYPPAWGNRYDQGNGRSWHGRGRRY